MTSLHVSDVSRLKYNGIPFNAIPTNELESLIDISNNDLTTLVDDCSPLSNAYRFLWEQSVEARPLLTFLLACYKHPLLREICEDVIKMAHGEALDIPLFRLGSESHCQLNAMERSSFNLSVIQALRTCGFISEYERTKGLSHYVATTFAVYINHLMGITGIASLQSGTTLLLDNPFYVKMEHLRLAESKKWVTISKNNDSVCIEFLF